MTSDDGASIPGKLGPAVLGGTQGAYRWVILLVTTGSQATIALIQMATGTLAPFVSADLQLSRAQVGLVGGAVNVGMILTAMLAGWAVDRWGERVVLVTGGLLAGLSIIAASRAGAFETFVPLLLLTGLWAATSTPAGSKAIMTWFPVSRRGFALGVRQTGVPLGGTTAALLLPALALRFGWRPALVGAGLIAMGGALICQITYREASEDLGSACREVSSGRGTTAGGGIREVLRIPGIWIASFTAVTLVGVQYSVVSYLELYLNDALGQSIRAASLYLALAQMAGVAGRIFWGVLSDTLFRGARRPALAAVGVVAAAMSVAMVFLGPSTPAWVLAGTTWFLGFTGIGWNGVYVALISEMVGKERAGTALGMGLSLVQMGVLVIPPFFGYLVDRTGLYRAGWAALAVLVLFGVSLLALVHEKTREPTPTGDVTTGS